MMRVLLFAVTMSALLAGCGSGGQHLPLPPEPSIVSTAFRCPELSPDSHPAGSGPLPMGATAALICDGRHGRAWAAPADHLVTGLDALVSLINRSPAAHAACETSIALPSYVMVFRYADGTRTVTGDPSACLLHVGSSNRKRAFEVWARYLALLTEQRSHTTAPSPAPPRGCSSSGADAAVTPVADLAHFRPGELCRVDRRGRLVGHPFSLPTHTLDTLGADVAGRRSRDHRYPPCSARATSLLLTGSDEWNDRIAFRIFCHRSVKVGYGDNLDPGQALRPRTDLLLQHLMARH